MIHIGFKFKFENLVERILKYKIRILIDNNG